MFSNENTVHSWPILFCEKHHQSVYKIKVLSSNKSTSICLNSHCGAVWCTFNVHSWPSYAEFIIEGALIFAFTSRTRYRFCMTINSPTPLLKLHLMMWCVSFTVTLFVEALEWVTQVSKHDGRSWLKTGTIDKCLSKCHFALAFHLLFIGPAATSVWVTNLNYLPPFTVSHYIMTQFIHLSLFCVSFCLYPITSHVPCYTTGEMYSNQWYTKILQSQNSGDFAAKYSWLISNWKCPVLTYLEHHH